MNVKPLHDRVLVKRLEEKETVKGRIIIPDTAKETFSVCCALSEFCWILLVISSIEAEISSEEAACSFAPFDISCEVDAI